MQEIDAYLEELTNLLNFNDVLTFLVFCLVVIGVIRLCTK
jgi:hypothetical protein